jgi:hypothetical protein
MICEFLELLSTQLCGLIGDQCHGGFKCCTDGEMVVLYRWLQ